MMFLEVQWSGPCQDIPSKVKEKFYISHLTIRKGTHCLVNLFGVYRQHISQCSDTAINFDYTRTGAVMACKGHNDQVTSLD